ncbi:hypothetical protein ACS0TY_033607 [Phlomoides rotata]
MANATLNQDISYTKKRSGSSDNQFISAKKHQAMNKAAAHEEDPTAALAKARHEFGEHGGVNISIEASATVMELETMRWIFSGELGADRDFFIYSHHFNPTGERACVL